MCEADKSTKKAMKNATSQTEDAAVAKKIPPPHAASE
jgi:hypothetical protein